MQLTGYSMLAEKAFGLPARRAFLYRIPDNRIFPIEITERMRVSVMDALAGMLGVAEEQRFPEATSVRG